MSTTDFTTSTTPPTVAGFHARQPALRWDSALLEVRP